MSKNDKPVPLPDQMVFLAYLDEFLEALQLQLEDDAERHGDEYLKRPKSGQTERIYQRYNEYLLNFHNHKEPIPWLKVAGNAFIAWLRETHPELSVHWRGHERQHGFFTSMTSTLDKLESEFEDYSDSQLDDEDADDPRYSHRTGTLLYDDDEEEEDERGA